MGLMGQREPAGLRGQRGGGWQGRGSRREKGRPRETTLYLRRAMLPFGITRKCSCSIGWASERSSGEMLTLSIALGSLDLNLHWFSSCRLPNLNSHLIISSRICNDM